MAETKHSDKRLVAGCWRIGETLGKGGFGFVKLGYHDKNGKPFALKFIRKNEENDKQAKQQAQLVATEINCLIRVQHENVLKLFAYRTSCEYPQQDGTSINTIMLVLELAKGGDLFDILYYTKKLELNLARTYFHQLCAGLKAIHDSGICHRDLKPQNLLLNGRFVLKITDFGLSKLFEKEQKKVMKTYYAGTAGYQAPEQILKRNFTPKCDVFSSGVILFILLAGYPPCHQAHYSDPFYKYIAQVQYEKFWLKHRLNNQLDEDCRDILNKTLCYQPGDRYTVDQMLEHSWVQSDEKLSPEKLASTMKELFKKAMEAKKEDAIKNEKIQQASQNRDPIHGEIPILAEHLNRRGRMFLLNENSKEFAEKFWHFLKSLAQAKRGNLKKIRDWSAVLKINLAMYEGDEKIGSAEQTAHINFYRTSSAKDALIVVDFNFPKAIEERHVREVDLFEKYANGYSLVDGDDPEWVDRLNEDDIDVGDLTSEILADLQANNGVPSAGLEKRMIDEYKITSDEFKQICSDNKMLEPIDFKMPTMVDFIIRRCGEYIRVPDSTDSLEDMSSASETEVDQEMLDFFEAFMNEDSNHAAAKSAERPAPTMETHGYVM